MPFTGVLFTTKCSVSCITTFGWQWNHYNDAIMSALASPITSVSIVCPIVCSGADQRKHQSSDLCEGNPPVTGRFLSQRANNAENFSIWWHHHVCLLRNFPSTGILFTPGTDIHHYEKVCRVQRLLTSARIFMVIYSLLCHIGQQNRVRAVTVLPLEWSFPYLVQIFISKRRCVVYKNFDFDPYIQGNLLVDLRKKGQRGLFSEHERSSL